MATIPIGDYGNAIARSGSPSSIPRGDPIGAAVERTSAIGTGVIEDIAAQQTRLQEQQRTAQTALTLAKTNNQMNDAHDVVARGVMDGSIPTEKAASTLQEQVGKIRDANMNGYMPEQRALMDSHLESTYGTLQRQLAGTVVKRQQQDVATTIDQFGEQVSREAARQGPGWAVQKFGAMVDFAGGDAGLNEQTRTKLKQSFSERSHATFFESAGVGALTRDDPTALRALMQQIAGPDGDALDPGKRASMTHQFFGWEQSLLAKRDRAANKADDEERRRYNAAVDVYNKGTDVALGGGYFSPEFITEMTTTAAGTKMEPAIADLVASQRTVAGFASRSAPERGAIIERMRAARATPGQGTDPANDRLLQAAETMNGKLTQQAEENPWAAAQQAGVIKDAPTFNVADPASAIQTVQQRMQAIGTVEAWTGKKVSPLQPVEVDQIQKLVRQLPVDQAASMLAGFGAAVGQSERVAALAKQLHDKDGALGMAMSYASAQTSEGRYTAELVLRGDQAIRDKTVTVDGAAETGWKGTIAKQIRGAYSNREAEDQVIDAAFKIAAANYAKDGSADVDRAIRLATGGIIERNGQKIPLPYGFADSAHWWSSAESKFNDRIEAIKAADLAPQLTFYGAGNIDLANRPVVKNKDGTVSTVRSIGVNIDGKEVLLPTVSNDGRMMTTEQAVAEYRSTGKYLGKFDTVAQANAYAESLHQQQATLYANGSGPFVYSGRVPIPLAQFVEALPHATLVHAGQGMYNVRSGTARVTNAAGVPILIKVTP